MRLLAMLVAVTLPLHGIADGVSSIHAPAHFHRVAQSAEPLPSVTASHHHIETNAHEHHFAEVQSRIEARLEAMSDASYVYPTKGDHYSSSTLNGPHNRAPTTQRDHEVPDNLIGHHSHGFEQVNVVYVSGHPDRTDLGAGKHASPSPEAALPAWSMTVLARLDPPALPQAGFQFRSHSDEPLLRPPSLIRFAPT